MRRRVRRPRLFGFTIVLAALGVLLFALPAAASAERILYADGHSLDLTRLATFGGHTAVDPGFGHLPEDGFDGCSDAEWAASLARTDFDVLVVGENAPDCIAGPTDLSPATLTAIGDYVRNGKPIIIFGAHASEDDFLNAVFGFSTTNLTSDSGETLIGDLQPAAAGTPFAGGPATLTTPSETDLLGSTPGTTIYSGPDGVYVFTLPFGSGVVTYLAWDFCCGSDAPLDDWYRVLDRAIQVKPPTPPAPLAPPDNTCLGQKATIVGTEGNDNLTGTPGKDVMVGLGGKDKLKGLGGNDLICGRIGADTLNGGPGSDKLQGNKGPDTLVGGAGGDQCRGGKGKDNASKCEAARALSAN